LRPCILITKFQQLSNFLNWLEGYPTSDFHSFSQLFLHNCIIEAIPFAEFRVNPLKAKYMLTTSNNCISSILRCGLMVKFKVLIRITFPMGQLRKANALYHCFAYTLFHLQSIRIYSYDCVLLDLECYSILVYCKHKPKESLIIDTYNIFLHHYCRCDLY